MFIKLWRFATSVLIKQKLTAVPPPGSSRKMFDTLYSMALNKMLLNLYLNANFDGVLGSLCLESTTNLLQKNKVVTYIYSHIISIFEGFGELHFLLCKYA